MTEHDDTGEHPFDTVNRAYQRFEALGEEHFDALIWTRESDGRPVLVTLRDLGSGDMFSMAILDSLQMREPHTLLAFTTTAELAAHGPFDGETSATTHAAPLAFTNTTVAATRAVPLHHPDHPNLPDDTWRELPGDLATAAQASLDDTGSVVLILLDRTRHVLAAVGPFTHYDAADTWKPTYPVDPGVDHLIVALHPGQPHQPAL